MRVILAHSKLTLVQTVCCPPSTKTLVQTVLQTHKSRLWSLAAFDGLLMSIANQSRSQKKQAGGGERSLKCPECEKLFSRDADIQVFMILFLAIATALPEAFEDRARRRA